jgi:hypothetical protein
MACLVPQTYDMFAAVIQSRSAHKGVWADVQQLEQWLLTTPDWPSAVQPSQEKPAMAVPHASSRQQAAIFVAQFALTPLVVVINWRQHAYNCMLLQEPAQQLLEEGFCNINQSINGAPVAMKFIKSSCQPCTESHLFGCCHS